MNKKTCEKTERNLRKPSKDSLVPRVTKVVMGNDMWIINFLSKNKPILKESKKCKSGGNL